MFNVTCLVFQTQSGSFTCSSSCCIGSINALYLFHRSQIGSDTAAYHCIPNLSIPSMQFNARFIMSLSAWLDDCGHAGKESLATE